MNLDLNRVIKLTVFMVGALASMLLFSAIIADAAASENKYIYLNDYGAVGDGVTDDYAALASAITDSATKNKPLYVSKGTYYSSKALDFTDPIILVGEGKNDCVFLFKDNVVKDTSRYWQKGIVSVFRTSISIKNVSFKYEANVSNPYNRSMNGAGSEGVLFSILDSSNVYFENTQFIVGGSLNPSVTCAWVKAEQSSIYNATFESCSFINTSESTVGGNLWFSNHDNSSLILCNLKVSNCTFEHHGHDESLGVWGYNVLNVKVANNTFSYMPSSTYAQSIISLGNPIMTNRLSNVFINGNRLNIYGYSQNAINVMSLSSDSTVELQNNIVSATLSPSNDFNAFVLGNCGNTKFTKATVTVTGGNIISLATFDRGGNAFFESCTANFAGGRKALVIRSIYSTNFADSQVKINNSHINIQTTNQANCVPTIQFPVDSTLTIKDTKVTTSGSGVNEIVFQTLGTSGSVLNNSIVLNNVSTDTNIIFSVNGTQHRNIELHNVKSKDVTYMYTQPGDGKTTVLHDCDQVDYVLRDNLILRK